MLSLISIVTLLIIIISVGIIRIIINVIKEIGKTKRSIHHDETYVEALRILVDKNEFNNPCPQQNTFENDKNVINFNDSLLKKTIIRTFDNIEQSEEKSPSTHSFKKDKNEQKLP